jgi:hypothetical protein
VLAHPDLCLHPLIVLVTFERHMESARLSGLFRSSCAASFEAWQLLKSGTEQVLNLLDPAMQNPGAGAHSYSKENSQYETVATDRREQKQSPKLQRELRRWLLRLMQRIGTPLDRGLNSFKKESIISSAEALCCGDSIEYRMLCGLHASSEHESCAKSSVERFRYFVFAYHCLGRVPQPLD